MLPPPPPRPPPLFDEGLRLPRVLAPLLLQELLRVLLGLLEAPGLGGLALGALRGLALLCPLLGLALAGLLVVLLALRLLLGRSDNGLDTTSPHARMSLTTLSHTLGTRWPQTWMSRTSMDKAASNTCLHATMALNSIEMAAQMPAHKTRLHPCLGLLRTVPVGSSPARPRSHGRGFAGFALILLRPGPQGTRPRAMAAMHFSASCAVAK